MHMKIEKVDSSDGNDLEGNKLLLMWWFAGDRNGDNDNENMTLAVIMKVASKYPLSVTISIVMLVVVITIMLCLLWMRVVDDMCCYA